MRIDPYGPTNELVTAIFHTMWYWAGCWKEPRWKGVPVLQNPLDMWMKQEVIHETRPTLIIEAGTAYGGTALFYADLFPFLKVVTIDTDGDKMVAKFKHKNITFIKGSSTDPKVVAKVKQMAKGKRVMVILDSLHTAEHVYDEMVAYAPMVTKGCYMIVEDTNLGGNPIINPVVPGSGPIKAVAKFMEESDEFKIEKGCEKYLMTFYPNGWLRRI